MILSQQATNAFLRVFRHTDQKIDLLVKTIDRTPVLIDEDETILFRIFDRNNRTVIEKTAELENFEKGHYSLWLSKEETASLPLGNYTWVMLLMGPMGERLLYTDKDYGANAPLRVLEGQYPPLPEALSIDPLSLTNGATSALVGAAQVGNPSGAHAFVLGTADYSGVVSIQASLDDAVPAQDSEWTEVKSSTYLLASGSQLIGFTGNYKWVRIVFSKVIGLMTILYRNQ